MTTAPITTEHATSKRETTASEQSRRSFGRSGVSLLLGIAFIAACFHYGMDLWLTPDQQGRRHYDRGEFKQAAAVFHDPMWQGAALYRAGEFEDAAQAFTRQDSDEGQFNQGNAWLMHGTYEQAIACYDRALEKRPGWKEAEENKQLAIARDAKLSKTGGDMGNQTLGADKIVFDKDAKNDEGQETVIREGTAASDQEIQAMWLRRIQTRPADFLKARFSYQQAMKQDATP